MFRPFCMAIFRFSVQYSVRRFLFLVWSGGEVRSHFTMYGWYRSDVWCPGCSSWAWSAVVVCAWRSSQGGAVFRSGDGGYALFHGFFSCVVIIRLSSGWLPVMLTAVVHVTHLSCEFCLHV